MSSKALSKKTFGIENVVWLLSAYITVCTILVIKCVLFLMKLWFWPPELKKSEHDNYVEGHIGFSFLLVEFFFVSTLALCVPPRFCRLVFIYMVFYTIGMTNYFLNPDVYQQVILATNAQVVFKYSLIFHYFSTPFFICASGLCTWILWRMSNVKPDYEGDEPYLVIYGGEESSTKKSDSE